MSNMSFNIDSLPLQMSEDELKNYPQFCSLLTSLKEKLTPDGSSVKMKKKLDTVQHGLSHSHHNWLINHIIYMELNELLANFEIRNQEGNLSPDERQIMLCLTKTLTYNEIGDYLHLHPGTSNHSTLFGLTQEDIDKHNPAKHLLNELQQTISPFLEERLIKKSDDIYNFYEPVKSLASASQRLMSAKSRSLPDIVEEKKLCLLQEKEALKKDRFTREQHFWTYYQKLLDCLSVIETIVNDYKFTCQAETDDITVEWLKIRCDALCLKVKLTQIQILCDTYTNETVKALKKISGYLDEAIQQSESQLTATSYSLQAYHNIGAEFKTLVNQFTLLQNEIENRKWALSTMRKTLPSFDNGGSLRCPQAGDDASPQSVDSLQHLSSASRNLPGDEMDAHTKFVCSRMNGVATHTGYTDGHTDCHFYIYR